ncbi:MAG TPA: type II toxin-antitoxin system VapC family toxin [Candidatus Baltobacteraceae bacterium]
MSPILLDTHAAVWAADGTLPKSVSSAIDAAAERGELLLSPITAWEIGNLVRKGRLSLPHDVGEYVRTMFGRPGVVTAAFSPAIAVAATDLPGAFHADPADRILIATAAEYGAQLVTRDKHIREYARVTKHLRCIAC